MSDRELLRRTVKNLPQMLPGVLLYNGLMTAGQFILKTAAPLIQNHFAIVLLVLFGAAGALILMFLELGTFRYCLRIGEGKLAPRPRSIFQAGDWKKYRVWVGWTILLITLAALGKKLPDLLLRSLRLDDITYHRISEALSYIKIFGYYVINLLFLSLVLLAVKTAFFRAPERGFWAAVVWGIKEGVRKWPRTVGPQLKFVFPLYLCLAVVQRALERNGSTMAEAVILLVVTLAANCWFYMVRSQLAAERYDPPPQAEGPAGKKGRLM